MGNLGKRFMLIFRSKANKQLDKFENPNETLDYSYEKQLELLRKVKSGVVDVATSRKRIELQINQLNTQANTLSEQAQKAINMGREDLARDALTRKANLTTQLSDLQTQHTSLEAEENKLVAAQQKLQTQVDAFRTRKETIKATYTAAKAQNSIHEAMSGIGDEFGDIGMAIQRAEDKTAQLQARSSAVDELMESGAFDSAMALGSGDSLSRELDSLSASSDVEAELAAMKGQLAAPERPKELG